MLHNHSLFNDRPDIAKLCDADFMYPDRALPKSLPPEIKVINNNRLTTPLLGNFNWSKYDLNENKYIDYISENNLSNLLDEYQIVMHENQYKKENLLYYVLKKYEQSCSWDYW